MKIDMAKFSQFFGARWAKDVCTNCGAKTWDVNETAMQLTEFGSEGGPAVPLVVVTCTSCGNTILVNAIVAEALPQDAGEASDQTLLRAA